MTEVSATGAHAELQLGPASVTPRLSAPLQNGVPVPEPVASEDPSSTIDCICGYNDDDGNTVLCEICNTWQHIECYYPTQIVPDVHECCRCRPRTLDTKAATQRQAQLRELQFTEDKRVKRPKSASHRKKTKDSVQINGWPATERDTVLERSGSPRDQPPPAKRAKTSHKPSASVTSVSQAANHPNGRRKNGVAAPGQSPAKSPPELSGGWDYFSPEFLQMQNKSPFQYTDSNSMTNIGVTNDLAAWVQDPEELAKVTNGEGPKEVFLRIDGTSEALEKMTPGVRLHSEVDKSYTSSDGLHPVISRLTVNSEIYSGNFVGEIRGQISRRDEYIQDPANRWQGLRHPDPFVFFAPSLPIVVDAREEGTDMRYIRRSCRPNTKMRIILDKADNYHFCLVADGDLKEGEEITLGWEIDQGIRELLHKITNNGSLRNQGFRRDDEQYICNWVSGVLANFGGCACAGANSCVLNRFDRRGDRQILDSGNTLRMPKGRKGKKGTHPSPLSTGRAVNSRASSEVANARGEAYDDRADSRSTSGSTRSKPTSRDNTPGGNAADEGLSAREKRKLEQLERRFQVIDHDDTPARKKKRNSAGSTLNTPGINTSRQLGLGLVDSQDPSPTNASNSRFGKHALSAFGNGESARRSNSTPIQAKTYVDRSTQTNAAAQDVYNTDLAPPKKRRISYAQRILARTRDEKPKPTKLPSNPTASSPLPTDLPAESQSTASATAASSMLPPPRPSPTLPQTLDPTIAEREPVKGEAQDEDTDLPGMPSEAKPTQTTADASTSPEQPQHVDSVEPPAPPQPTIPSQPPPAPWPAKTASPDPPAETQTNTSATSPSLKSSTTDGNPSDAPSTSSTRPQNLHVALPPVPSFSPATPTTPSMSATPGSITGSSMAQSPLSVTTTALVSGPLLSPAISSAVAPSPLKKKMSLSDYMGRRKAAAKEAAKEVTEAKTLDTLTETDRKEEEDKDQPLALQQVESNAVEDVDMEPVPVREADDAKEEGQASAAEAPAPEATDVKLTDGVGEKGTGLGLGQGASVDRVADGDDAAGTTS